MPNYSSLETQVTAIKAEISSGLAASQYSAQDLVYVAKALEAVSHVVAPDGVSNITVNDNIYLGTLAEGFATTASLTNPTLVVTTTATDYAQIAFSNRSSNANASTDLILYSNNGTDASGYIDMGITSSNFSDPDFTITGKGDGYIFMVGAAAGSEDKGNLVLATSDSGTQNKIIFAAGGLSSDNTQMVITPDVNVHIEIDTPSTSPTTGALTVVGGVGISGNVNIDGTITFGGAGTTVETANLAVTDPLVFTGNDNQGDALDLGLVGEYANTVSTITKTVSNKALASNVATITTSATHGFAIGDIAVITGVDATFNGTHYVTAVPTTTTFTFAKTATNVTSAAASGSVSVSGQRRYAAVARDASDGVIKFFKDITTKPTSTINFSEANAGFAAVQLGALTAASATIGNVSNTELQYLDGVTSAIQTQIDSKATASLYAALNSPTLTGTPLSTTAAVDTNTTQIATTAYVIGQGYLKSSAASSTYAPLAGAALNRPVFTSPLETITVSATAATGTVQVDVVTSGAKYFTSNASADWTFNFRGDGSTTLNSLMSNGQSITVAFLVTNGSTAYKPTVFQVDGSAVTPKWNGGTAPAAGNANSIDSYTFTIIKTASATFTVLGAQSKFA
jgi:ribosomal protein S11